MLKIGRPALAFALVAGCVWADIPPAAVQADMCAACAPEDACQLGACVSRCSDDVDDYASCADPARICVFGDCELPCRESDCARGLSCNSQNQCGEDPCADEDCPDGLRCESFGNECKDRCFIDSDCRAGLVCCDVWDSIDGLCDSGTCW